MQIYECFQTGMSENRTVYISIIKRAIIVLKMGFSAEHPYYVITGSYPPPPTHTHIHTRVTYSVPESAAIKVLGLIV